MYESIRKSFFFSLCTAIKPGEYRQDADVVETKRDQSLSEKFEVWQL